MWVTWEKIKTFPPETQGLLSKDKPLSVRRSLSKKYNEYFVMGKYFLSF